MAKPRTTRPAKTGSPLLTERRAWVRYPSDRDTFCQPGIGRKERDLWWQAQIRDISNAGIGLILNRRFTPGTILSVELPTTHSGSVILQLARVVHASPQADGRWLIGCEFAKQLSDDDLASLTGHDQGANKLENRKAQ
jgi:hypothetical protein